MIEGNDREILYRAIFRVGLKLPSLVVDKVTIKGEGVVDREVYREVYREVDREVYREVKVRVEVLANR